MLARFLPVLLILLAGCSGLPPREAPPETAAERAALRAPKLVGTPYRYGGASPIDGFDCSGLVQFLYREAGVALPRSTGEQRQLSRLISASELRPGDLIFFDLEGRKNSHVAIYTGGGAFVHAPSTGRDVRVDRLDSPYWKRQISEMRRL
jgi:murein DD-endopeptidase